MYRSQLLLLTAVTSSMITTDSHTFKLSSSFLPSNGQNLHSCFSNYDFVDLRLKETEVQVLEYVAYWAESKIICFTSYPQNVGVMKKALSLITLQNVQNPHSKHNAEPRQRDRTIYTHRNLIRGRRNRRKLDTAEHNQANKQRGSKTQETNTWTLKENTEGKETECM